jgi:V/A-type H+-transporting ATPase subunit K
MKRFNLFLGFIAVTFFIAGCYLLIHSRHAYAQVEEHQLSDMAKARVTGWGFLAASISVGLSCVGAGIAVSVVGSAAMGAVSERPELMGRSLIYVGLAEGIAIYGLIVAIMVLGKI